MVDIILGASGVLLGVISLWYARRQSGADRRHRRVAVVANDLSSALNKLQDAADAAIGEGGPLTRTGLERFGMDGALRQIQRIVREAPALELERFLTPQREGGIDLVSEIRAFTGSALPEGPGRQSVRVDMVRMTQQQVVAAHRLIAAIDQMRAAIRPHLA